jgi:hypothetical protein
MIKFNQRKKKKFDINDITTETLFIDYDFLSKLQGTTSRGYYYINAR